MRKILGLSVVSVLFLSMAGATHGFARDLAQQNAEALAPKKHASPFMGPGSKYQSPGLNSDINFLYQNYRHKGPLYWSVIKEKKKGDTNVGMGVDFGRAKIDFNNLWSNNARGRAQFDGWRQMVTVDMAQPMTKDWNLLIKEDFGVLNGRQNIMMGIEYPFD